MGAKRYVKKIVGYIQKPIWFVNKRFAWNVFAQNGEYLFHAKDTWRQSSAFEEHSKKLFTIFGFELTEFDGKLIMDLGCGSKLRTKVLTGAQIIAVEPLANRFINHIEWSDLKEAASIYSKPAEDFIPELENKLDAVFSINVLDHCYEFSQIVENIYKYLKPGGLAVLSFDSHEEADFMHPLLISNEFCSDIFLRTGFEIENQFSGLGELGSTYGHGESLTYLLRKH